MSGDDDKECKDKSDTGYAGNIARREILKVFKGELKVRDNFFIVEDLSEANLALHLFFFGPFVLCVNPLDHAALVDIPSSALAATCCDDVFRLT